MKKKHDSVQNRYRLKLLFSKVFSRSKDFHVQSENNSSVSESSSSSEADEVQYESRVPLPVQTINSSDDVICLDSD